MAEYKLIDTYVIPNLDCTIELVIEEGKYRVRCWKNEDDSLNWDMDGVVLTDDGHRQTRRPYTDEAEARVEFDRWRK